MKKDIEAAKEPVKGVTVTIIKNQEESWEVYLLNRSPEKIETVLITSRGYGRIKGEEQKTSLLRHAIPYVDQGSYAKVEAIDPAVFHLNNEFWVSYYIGRQMFDKKFIFVPDTITEKNLTFIPELESYGVLHD